MYPSYIDTDKMVETGYNIIDLAVEYELEITKLFKRLNNMPYVTKEWIGGQAEKYVSIVSLDKEELMAFGENIKSFGREVIKHAQNYNNKVRESIREECTNVR